MAEFPQDIVGDLGTHLHTTDQGDGRTTVDYNGRADTFIHKNEICNASWSNTVATRDYRTIVATLAFRSDAVLRIVERRNGANPNGRERRLVITIPGAEYWYVAPDTIVDVDKNLQLVKFKGENVLRDDRQMLRTAMAFIKAWYGKPRASVAIAIKRTDKLVELGAMVRAASTGGGKSEEVNSCVTSIGVNCKTGVQTIQTNYGELDFSAWAKQNG